MQDLKDSGKDAAYLPDVDSIVAHVGENAQGGDIVVVFSNGGFGGIHGKLLERLGRCHA
jgi:UDP-N-acetylmuramate: L-alanyl-gamma-D-glutamyl-meso-diaminopimelate ligase